MAQRYNQIMPSNMSPGLPEEFLGRLRMIVPADQYRDILASYSRSRLTTFRVNTLKSDRVSLRTSLERQGFVLEEVPWYADAFMLRNKSLRELTETREYAEGLLYVQSLSSMLPPLILHPQPGERVLDITAAPGSKTTQMAALMDNRGTITANDASRVRIYRLQANLKLQGVTIATVTHDDARGLWQKKPEYYDKALVDVPCSMEGRFAVSDPKSYKDWSLRKVHELSRLQRWMLRSAVSATKPGGTIVYSTCTLSPEENEQVLDWLITKENGNVQPEPVHLDGLMVSPAVHSWEGKTYCTATGLSARIYPSAVMEGFFIAKLRKIHSSVPVSMRPDNAV